MYDCAKYNLYGNKKMVSLCPHKSYPGFQAVVKITCFRGRREKDGVEKKQHPQYPRKSYGFGTTEGYKDPIKDVKDRV